MKKNINNLDFDDLIRNFNLKKFIKYLDKESKYKTTYPPFDYKKPPDLYADLINSSTTKKITYKKLLDGIVKNDGDFIHLAIQNGTLLKYVHSNFKLEKDYLFTFESQTGTDFYGFHIVSSKINKCFYILLDYGDSLGNQIFYCIKKIKSKELAIKFVKQEKEKLKKNRFYE